MIREMNVEVLQNLSQALLSTTPLAISPLRYLFVGWISVFCLVCTVITPAVLRLRHNAERFLFSVFPLYKRVLLLLSLFEREKLANYGCYAWNELIQLDQQYSFLLLPYPDFYFSPNNNYCFLFCSDSVACPLQNLSQLASINYDLLSKGWRDDPPSNQNV